VTSEVKPAAFARGVPAAEKNGIYGLEQAMLADPEAPIVAIVTFGVEEIVDKQLKGETYPIVSTRHIEPLRTREAIDVALKLQADARQNRVGAAELDMPLEEPVVDFETELADKPLDDGDELAAKRKGKD
jgi:hypothetical protein